MRKCSQWGIKSFESRKKLPDLVQFSTAKMADSTGKCSAHKRSRGASAKPETQGMHSCSTSTGSEHIEPVVDITH